MMIGGQFNTAADWIRAADAVGTIDDFAARNGGNAPVFVFADSGGAFNNDTECVNGVRGNAADHLTEDVVPYMVDHFRVSDDPANWGVVGWVLRWHLRAEPDREVPGSVPAPSSTSTVTTARTPGRKPRRSTGFRRQCRRIRRLASGHGDRAARPYEGRGRLSSRCRAALVVAAISGVALQEEPKGGPRQQSHRGRPYALPAGQRVRHRLRRGPGGGHDWPFAAGGLRRRAAVAGLADRHPEAPEVALPGTSGQPRV